MLHKKTGVYGAYISVTRTCLFIGSIMRLKFRTDVYASLAR